MAATFRSRAAGASGDRCGALPSGLSPPARNVGIYEPALHFPRSPDARRGLALDESGFCGRLDPRIVRDKIVIIGAMETILRLRRRDGRNRTGNPSALSPVETRGAKWGTTVPAFTSRCESRLLGRRVTKARWWIDCRHNHSFSARRSSADVASHPCRGGGLFDLDPPFFFATS